MSKLRVCVKQVTEIAGVELVETIKSRRLAAGMLHRHIYLLLLGLSLLAACNQHEVSSSALTASGSSVKSPGAIRILRRGLPGEPRTLDPQQADDNYSFEVLRDLYEGLTAEDPYGRIVPGVARSWSVNSKGNIYSFNLRANAKWSDGSRVTASEFVDGLRRAVDPRTASGSAKLLDVIKGASEIIAGKADVATLGVNAIGSSIVKIELVHPAPFILQILSQPIAAPLHHGDSTESRGSNSEKSAEISNGAFVLLKRVDGSFIDLTRNQSYWDASHVAIQRVRYITAESEATELREYMAGQLDMTYSIPLQDLDRMHEEYPSEVQTAPILATYYLALNMSEQFIRDNLDLRKALSMAIDRELIAKNVMRGVTPAYSFVAPGMTNYVPQSYEWAKWPRVRRIDVARTLLAKAGYTKNNPLHLRLYFNSDETVRQVMIAVAGSWNQNLGVTTDLVSNEFRVFLVGRKQRDQWDIARIGWTADYDDPSSFLDVFAKDSSQNDPGYVSSKFLALIDSAQGEPDLTKRISVLQLAEFTLLNDYPIIPIYFYRARRMVKPYIGGSTITPLNRTYSKYLYWKN